MTVSELLSASHAAHQRYRDAHDLQRATQADQNPAMRLALAEALHARQQAHDLDLAHVDPAWTAEQAKTGPADDTHSALMAFYRAQLAT